MPVSRSRLYHPKLAIGWVKSRFGRFWHRSLWYKLVAVFLLVLALWIGVMYGIARWYIWQESSKPLVLGTSFVPAYAQSLGLDPKHTMDALISGVGVRHFRLVSYWDQLEPTKGQYDFSLLDWQFAKVEKAGAKVTLSIGLRQPRWPECHMPSWASSETQAQWQPQLMDFMTAVINRYKDLPALDSYQVENEYFLRGFGICETIPGALDRSRLVSEYDLVKKLDPAHKAIIARSNNAIGWPVGAPTPDEYGISIYKRAWENRYLHRYIEYPFPAWYYAFVAGWEKIMTGRDLMVHELQAEAWPPNYQTIPGTSLAEQNKSFNASRFEDRVEFGKGTGMREIYLWGSEYWYYRLVKLHDPSLWNVAKQEFQQPGQDAPL